MKYIVTVEVDFEIQHPEDGSDPRNNPLSEGLVEAITDYFDATETPTSYFFITTTLDEREKEGIV